METNVKDIGDLKTVLEKQISDSSNVFIIGHNSPDFDSIASAIGLSLIAKHLGKKANIIVNDEDLKIEPGVKRIIDEGKEKFSIKKQDKALEDYDENSLLIVTDVNKDHMISLGEELKRFKRIIVIDHHKEDDKTIPTENKFICVDRSSSSEIVTILLTMLKIKIPEEVANYLLAGISLDTQRFKQNTTGKTHDVAKRLIDVYGADIDKVNSLFLEDYDTFCRICNLIINGTLIQTYANSLQPLQISFTLNRENPHTLYLKEDFAKAADKMISFLGTDAAFAFGFVDENTVHISARSTKSLNVGDIMTRVGGGGNNQSGGARLNTTNLLEVEQKLIKAVHQTLKEDTRDISTAPRVMRKRKKNGIIK